MKCADSRCGREYRDDASGRHNHKVMYDHAPTPERSPYERLVREAEALTRRAAKEGS